VDGCLDYTGRSLLMPTRKPALPLLPRPMQTPCLPAGSIHLGVGWRHPRPEASLPASLPARHRRRRHRWARHRRGIDHGLETADRMTSRTIFSGPALRIDKVPPSPSHGVSFGSCGSAKLAITEHLRIVGCLRACAGRALFDVRRCRSRHSGHKHRGSHARACTPVAQGLLGSPPLFTRIIAGALDTPGADFASLRAAGKQRRVQPAERPSRSPTKTSA